MSRAVARRSQDDGSAVVRIAAERLTYVALELKHCGVVLWRAGREICRVLPASCTPNQVNSHCKCASFLIERIALAEAVVVFHASDFGEKGLIFSPLISIEGQA